MSTQSESQSRVESDPVRPWFEALEEMGESIDIRFGRVDMLTNQIEWHSKKHSEFDGIGGFANILRSQGILLEDLPKTVHPRLSAGPMLMRAMPEILSPRRRPQWSSEVARGKAGEESVAWHVFSRQETQDLIELSKKVEVSVNSLLLRYLDRATRPFLAQPSAQISWMVPVNLRGEVESSGDEGNHSSYLSVDIKKDDSLSEVHCSVRRCIERGQHWVTWSSLMLGRFLPKKLKKWLLRRDRATLKCHVGGFSNLGIWDSTSPTNQADGQWIFCPPVLSTQKIGAGCLTDRGRLSLVVQFHPGLTKDPRITEELLDLWIEGLRQNRK